MIDEGVLGKDDHVELINGMIIDMSPSGPSHDYVISHLASRLYRIEMALEVRVQSTLVISEGQVYDPDLMLIKPRPDTDSYLHRLPDAKDAVLVIEVACTSMTKDRDVKMPAFATAGIEEYWLIDVETEKVLVHRDPSGRAYQSIQKLSNEAMLEAICLPGQSWSVASLFE